MVFIIYSSSCTGSGIHGWETDEEEDIWEISLDQVCFEAEECEDSPVDPEMTIGELMEWRYLRAELEKEQVDLRARCPAVLTLMNAFASNVRRVT